MLHNTGYGNTGNLNTGGWNTGSGNTGHRNTGHRNTGGWNTGNLNTGHQNTGDRNTGSENTGHQNTGGWNTGDLNTGDRNTGDWNTGDLNTGYFNQNTPHTIQVFDAPCSREEWVKAVKPSFLYFALNVWIPEFDMTEKEKENHPTYKTTGGYLKQRDYKEAFKESYENASAEDKALLLKLPNFDAQKFFEISGIDVRVDGEAAAKKAALIAKAEELLKQAEEL